MRQSIPFVYFVILLFSIGGCTTKEKSSTLLFDNISITAEGPLFEGSNTAQAEIKNQLNAFAKENGIAAEDFKTATLKSMQLTVADSINFDLFSSINVQFVSDKTDMIDAASVNKIDKGSKTLQLTLSGEQKDLIEVLKQDNFTFVADGIIEKDSSISIPMKAKFEIELTY